VNLSKIIKIAKKSSKIMENHGFRVPEIIENHRKSTKIIEKSSKIDENHQKSSKIDEN